MVDLMLIPLFENAPTSLRQFFFQSKKTRKKRAKDSGGMSDKCATHYERLLAVVHVLNMLDVWRRNTDHFLARRQ